MSLIQIFLLAIIQGITEFLPISSSAHLILPSALFNYPDQGLAFDVAVHVGTLSAVLWYLRDDVRNITGAWFMHCFRGTATPESRLGWMIIVATIPAGIAGLLLDDFIEANLRSVAVIATTTIFFGLLLGIADKYSRRQKRMDAMGWKTAIAVGFAQALALIPGTSRSGITMTAALAMGLDRVSAARFSFLLSIPVILLSGSYKGLELLTAGNPVNWWEIGLGILLSAVFAYVCIHLFLSWINRLGMMPFVWYRLILGTVLFGLIATGSV